MIKNILKIRSFSIGLRCLISACAQHNLPTPRFPPTPTIGEDDIRSDLSTWNQRMSEVHPDISHRVDLTRLKKVRSEIEQSIDGDMTQLEVWRLFALINPVLRDGHNGIIMPKGREWIEEYLKGGGYVFPFSIYIDVNEQLFISGSNNINSSFNAGDEITSINGIKASQIVTELLARIHGDTPLFRPP